MKKTFSILGMIVSIFIIIVGYLTLSGSFGDASYSGSTTTYDSGFALFGGDYYTYSVNNSAETASAARATANNLREISDILCSCLGWFIICFGLVSFCAFGIVYADSFYAKKKKAIRTVKAAKVVDAEKISASIDNAYEKSPNVPYKISIDNTPIDNNQTF